MSAPAEIRIPTPGLTFGALSWGAADAPLALLVHGYPDTAWTWRHLGPYLAGRGWRVVAPFSRGYAPTDLAPNGRYRVSDQAGDLLALHTALGGDDRAVLIGHDWGALATRAVTTRDPARFTRYVALAVPPAAALLRPWRSVRTVPLGLRQVRMSWYLAYNQLPGAERGLSRVIPKLWRDWSPGYPAATDLEHVFAALDDAERLRAALGYYRDSLRGGLRETLRLGSGAPLLYLHGARDGCVHVEIGRGYAEPGVSFRAVDGVGHFLHLEAPDRVNPLIGDYLGAR